MKRVRISSDGVVTQVRIGSQLLTDVQEVLIRLRPSGPAVVTLTIYADEVEVDGQAVLNFGELPTGVRQPIPRPNTTIPPTIDDERARSKTQPSRPPATVVDPSELTESERKETARLYSKRRPKPGAI